MSLGDVEGLPLELEDLPVQVKNILLSDSIWDAMFSRSCLWKRELESLSIGIPRYVMAYQLFSYDTLTYLILSRKRMLHQFVPLTIPYPKHISSSESTPDNTYKDRRRNLVEIEEYY